MSTFYTVEMTDSVILVARPGAIGTQTYSTPSITAPMSNDSAFLDAVASVPPAPTNGSYSYTSTSTDGFTAGAVYKWASTYSMVGGKETNVSALETVTVPLGAFPYAQVTVSVVHTAAPSGAYLWNLYRTVAGGSQLLLVAGRLQISGIGYSGEHILGGPTTDGYLDHSIDAHLGRKAPPSPESVGVTYVQLSDQMADLVLTGTVSAGTYGNPVGTIYSRGYIGYTNAGVYIASPTTRSPTNNNWWASPDVFAELTTALTATPPSGLGLAYEGPPSTLQSFGGPIEIPIVRTVVLDPPMSSGGSSEASFVF